MKCNLKKKNEKVVKSENLINRLLNKKNMYVKYNGIHLYFH